MSELSLPQLARATSFPSLGHMSNSLVHRHAVCDVNFRHLQHRNPNLLNGIYSATTALQVAELNQQLIAQNLGNADVPGYRRAMLSVTPVDHMQIPSGTEGGALGLGVHVESVMRDFRAGTLQVTNRPLDVAIDGDAFFAVQGPNGPLYTRGGVFRISPDNTLVTTGGHEVLGHGAPIRVPAGASPSQISVSEQGDIRIDGETVGRFDLVAFEDNQLLFPVGPTLFSGEVAHTTAPENVSLKQGLRERSNVEVTDELVRMMIGLRQHEAAQRALRAMSDAVQRHATAP